MPIVTVCGQPFILDNEYSASTSAGILYAKLQEKQQDWKSVLAGLVGLYGVVQQYRLNERMVECAERAKDQAQEQFEFVKMQFDSVFKPLYDCMKKEFEDFVSVYTTCEEEFVQQYKDCEPYEPRFEDQKGRVLGVVSAQFDNGAKQRKRQIGKYHTGRCKSESLRFALAKATAMTDATNNAFRYEEALKLRLDEQAFSRKLAAIGVAQNVGNRVFGGANSSGNVFSGGLGRVSQAFGQTLDAYGSFASAASGQSDFFGSLSNGAFSYAGYNSFGRPTSPGNLGYGSYGGYTGSGYNGSVSSGFGNSGAGGYQSLGLGVPLGLLGGNSSGLNIDVNDGTVDTFDPSGIY